VSQAVTPRPRTWSLRRPQHRRATTCRRRELALAGLLDTLAIGAAGLDEPAAHWVRWTLEPLPEGHGVRTWRGEERYAVTDVALLHGTACHALDWDDFMHPMHGHCSSVLLPALWGLAESMTSPAPTWSTPTSSATKVDWLVPGFSPRALPAGWHATSTIGALGAAAARRAARATRTGARRASGSRRLGNGLQNNFGADQGAARRDSLPATACGAQARRRRHDVGAAG
jgi:hypothetical protein